MLYLDTSALLKLYIRETGSEEIHDRISAQDHPLPIWEIQEAEFLNALHLKVFWKEITQDQAHEQMAIFRARQARGLYYFPEIQRDSLMDTFCRLSAETPRLGCRTMDIFHVACAIEIGATTFLTYDDRQCELARYAGLPTD